MLTDNTLSQPQIISLPQVLDAKPIQALWRELKPTIRHSRAQVLLDMSHIETLDWQGVRLLMDAFLIAQKSGGRLAVMKANPAVRLFLDLTQVSALLPIFDDEASALAWFMV